MGRRVRVRLIVVFLGVSSFAICSAQEYCPVTDETRALGEQRQALIELMMNEVADHRYEPCGRETVCGSHVDRFAQQVDEIDRQLVAGCPEMSIWRDGVEGLIETREQPDGTLFQYDDDPSRAQLHDALVASRLDDSAANQESLGAIMTMGAPGSGKSSALRALALCQEDVVMVDPDLFKLELVEYNVGRAAHDRLAADRVHRESSMLAKRLRDEAIASHRDMCIDGVLSKKDAALKLIRRLQTNGYQVTVVAAVVPFEISYQRVVSRGEATGRFVPEEFARRAHDNIELHRNDILRAANRGYAFDTSGSVNEAPKLIAHFENGDKIGRVN